MSNINKLGFDVFVEMISTKRNLIELKKIIAPIILLSAIEESISSGREKRF